MALEISNSPLQATARDMHEFEKGEWIRGETEAHMGPNLVGTFPFTKLNYFWKNVTNVRYLFSKY